MHVVNSGLSSGFVVRDYSRKWFSVLTNRRRKTPNANPGMSQLASRDVSIVVAVYTTVYYSCPYITREGKLHGRIHWLTRTSSRRPSVRKLYDPKKGGRLLF